MRTSPVADLVFDDLGLPDVPAVVTAWLVPLGAVVLAGEPVVEITCREATVELTAPITGRLAERYVEEDEPVEPGDLLARIEPHVARTT